MSYPSSYPCFSHGDGYFIGSNELLPYISEIKSLIKYQKKFFDPSGWILREIDDEGKVSNLYPITSLVTRGEGNYKLNMEKKRQPISNDLNEKIETYVNSEEFNVIPSLFKFIIGKLNEFNADKLKFMLYNVQVRWSSGDVKTIEFPFFHTDKVYIRIFVVLDGEGPIVLSKNGKDIQLTSGQFIVFSGICRNLGWATVHKSPENSVNRDILVGDIFPVR